MIDIRTMGISLDELTEIAVNAKDFRSEKQALHAVEWMEQRGLTETIAVGNFGLQVLKKGLRLKLPAGKTFTSTHPQHRGNGPILNGRARYFHVANVHTGFVDYHKIDRAQVRNPQVVWAGAGSYWFYADINDVEIAE